jgi:hypothetical protein
MMATTHALAGAALAAAVAVVAPELGPAALVGGLLGGGLPDLDLYRDHRRRLHFPTYYAVLSIPGVGIALIVTTPLTVAIAIGLVAAAFHSQLDRIGGGLELRPWEATSRKAVYDHARRRWYPPMRWVRYDGAPEDLGLAIGFAVPALIVYDGTAENLLLAILSISALYVMVRRRLPDLAERLAGALPPALAAHVPERFHS